MAVLTGDSGDCVKWLKSMGFDLSNLCRVVIVIEPGEVVKVYAESVGDDRIFHEIPEGLRECIAQRATPGGSTKKSGVENAEPDLRAWNDAGCG